MCKKLSKFLQNIRQAKPKIRNAVINRNEIFRAIYRNCMRNHLCLLDTSLLGKTLTFVNSSELETFPNACTKKNGASNQKFIRFGNRISPSVH